MLAPEAIAGEPMTDSQTHAGEITEALSNFDRDGFVVFENVIEPNFTLILG